MTKYMNIIDMDIDELICHQRSLRLAYEILEVDEGSAVKGPTVTGL